jgi:hypothetical protein
MAFTGQMGTSLSYLSNIQLEGPVGGGGGGGGTKVPWLLFFARAVSVLIFWLLTCPQVA